MSTVATLGVIFNSKKENNNYSFDTIALIESDLDLKNFFVATGKYEGETSVLYDRVVSTDSLSNCPIEADILDETEGNKKMFILSPRTLNAAIQKFDGNIEDAIKMVYEDLCDLHIHINKDDTIYIIKEEREKDKDKELEEIFSSKERSFSEIINSKENQEGLRDYSNSILSELLKDYGKLCFTQSLLDQFKNMDNSDDSKEEKEVSFVIPIFDGLGIETRGNLMKRLHEEKQKEKKAEEKKEEVKKIDGSDVNSMIETISRKIVGQDEAIKTLALNVYYNQLLIDELTKDEEYDPSLLDSSKVNLLLDGETGTGKTAIEKEIARLLGLPIVITNANSFSETGYVGPTITDILARLLEQADGDIEKAERGIIVLDEIDKIATKDGNLYDMKRGVQEELLSFIGGGEYEVELGPRPYGDTVIFDTSKITFILSGAFTDLRDEKIKESNKSFNPMGFSPIQSNKEKSYVITPEDYIKYGLMREFFGRIKVLTYTKSYSIDDYKTILLESEISPMKNLERTVKLFGYKGISFSDSFIERVAKEASEMKTGARSLQTIMLGGIQNKLLERLNNHEFDEDKLIELTEDLIDEYKKGNVRKY